MKYVIGMDYGSDSVRAVLVNAWNGEIVAESVAYYPRWSKMMYCNPVENIYRQHPLDYIETMEAVIAGILEKGGQDVASRVVGISVDTTGSTPVLTDRDGVPLALRPEFRDNPNAMLILWKDHSAVNEAEEINEYTARQEVNYLKYMGGIYSSEWVWAKALHVLRVDKSIRDTAYSWIEHCDWIPALLTGNQKPEHVKRSRCAAGHKAMWHTDWNGLPPDSYFERLDPLLSTFTGHLFKDTYTSDCAAGVISPEWAERLGLPKTTVIGVGAFDCHFGAVGGGIKTNTLVRIVGTSTCDILLTEKKDLEGCVIPGICGQVDGSVVPGYLGLEAGQSSVGDAFAWCKRLLMDSAFSVIEESNLLSPEQKLLLREEAENKMLNWLTIQAEKLETTKVVATDWLNGRRTPDANQRLKATISELTLATTGEELYCAIVEATAFGARAIVERFTENGAKVDEIIGIGGVAKKSPFIMQVMADVIGMPIKIATPLQACALGSAMFAAVAASLYKDVFEAQKAMMHGFDKEYIPDSTKKEYYYKKYE
ncbi:MAG: ribulokinase, partial [Odoribacter sp.]|nr:ribulokinase [Odoribacter sp.]